MHDGIEFDLNHHQLEGCLGEARFDGHLPLVEFDAIDLGVGISSRSRAENSSLT